MSVVINGSAGVTTNSGAIYDSISSGTAVASTSGTSIDFTNIPSWVKRITVMFNGVSTNGTSIVQVQVGNGSFINTGYTSTGSRVAGSTASSAAYTSGFGISTANAANASYGGSIVIQNISSNSWVANGVIADTGQIYTTFTSGSISLSGTLDRVRITTVNGTDTFDAGSINIIYE